VLVWQDYHGQYTAAALEWGCRGPLAAFDATRAGALRQLRDSLKWQVKTHDYEPETDFFDAELFYVRVEVRPEYQDPDSRQRCPCEETITVRVPCVRGRTNGGIVCCSLPTLAIGFYCHDPASLRRMVVERVSSELSGWTPKELSRLLAPKEAAIDQVLVRTRRRRRGVGRTEAELPTLALVADPMGKSGFRKSHSAAYQRQHEVAALAERLRAKTGSVLLLGEDGVGKTTLLAAAVQAVERTSGKQAEGERAAAARHRFWRTSAARLIAGMQYLGQWQERCEEVIEELSGIAGVLCVEGLIDLVRLGGGDPTASLAAFLLPYLQNGQLRLVAEATPSELDACRRVLPGLPQAFETVRVDELEGTAAAAALEEVASSGSRQMGLELEEGVPHAALRLFRRFMPYHPLPGRGGEFLRRLFDRVKQSGKSRVETDQVVEGFICETGLPESFLDDELPLPFHQVLAALRKEVIGQDEACRTVARLVCTLKTGLNDPRRPVGALLFCGPTGVGKTQLAKTLSQYLFGYGDHGARLVRLDMSEYSAAAAAERLVSKADGTPSDFIGTVRRQPFVVVLFDEIEKAAPEVFDMLLGLLDEGRLTDRYGRTTWFRTAIVVMTSNLGTSRNESIGFVDSSGETYEREVRSFFRPEFFNRLDGVVTFSPLGRETCVAVARKELADLARREGFAKRRLQLRFGDSLVDRLVEEAFDPRYGARPLQRAIERHVVSRISRYLVKNAPFRAGTLEIDFVPTRDEVVIRVAAG